MLLQRLPEFCIARGSTPCLEIGMPLELEREDVIYATFAQGRKALLEYNLNGSASTASEGPSGTMEIDLDDHKLLRIYLTQADTLKLEAGEVDLQLRMKREDAGDALADTFHPWTGVVIGSAKEGVI